VAPGGTSPLQFITVGLAAGNSLGSDVKLSGTAKIPTAVTR